MEVKKLRIVTFNYLPCGYNFASEWVSSNGHEHVLSVTTPGPLSRPTPSYIEVVKEAPRAKDVLVTTRLDTVAEPLIRALKPDLILSFTFPYRITPEICEIPKLGAVNIHPSVLPAFRGPNPMRQFYEGASVFGATAHRIAPEYDTGNILSVKSAELPREVTPAIMSQWADLIREAIAEGMARAIAGDCGAPQDASQVTYAAPYTELEKWIDFSEPSHIIQRKVLALNISGGLARASINGDQFIVKSAEKVSDTRKLAGSILKDEKQSVVRSADGAVLLCIEPLQSTKNSSCPLPLAQLGA